MSPNIQVADTAQKNAGDNVAVGNALPSASSDQVTSIKGQNDTTPVAVTPTGVAHGQFGDVTIQADGSYSYQANAALDALTPADQKTDEFSVTTTGGATQNLAFDITGVNDAPVVSGPVTLIAIAEDSGPRLITQAELLGNASDVDGPSRTAVNLQVASGGGTLTNNNDGTWTYHPAPNGDTAVTFSYSVTDGIAAPVATTASLDITAVNDAPVIDLLTLAGVQTSATTASFTESGGVVTVVPQLTLADVDSPTLAGATVTLTDAQNGDVLSLLGQAGTSGTLAGGIDFAISGMTVTFSNVSSVANYQAALQLVQFNNTVVAPDTTDRTFSIQVDDGAGANNLTNATATLTVGSVNHAPQVTGLGTSVTVNEDGSVPLTGATVTDVDSTDILTVTVSVGLQGTLTSLATQSELNQLTSATGDGTNLITISGSVSAVNAVVAAGVTYAPVANYNGPDQLVLSVADNHGGSDSKQVDITVTAINDAPVATITPACYSATEQVALALKNTGLSISDVDAGSGPMTVTLSVGEGTLTVTAGNSGARSRAAAARR